MPSALMALAAMKRTWMSGWLWSLDDRKKPPNSQATEVSAPLPAASHLKSVIGLVMPEPKRRMSSGRAGEQSGGAERGSRAWYCRRVPCEEHWLGATG